MTCSISFFLRPSYPCVALLSHLCASFPPSCASLPPLLPLSRYFPRLSFLFWRQATLALVSQPQDLPPTPNPHLLCSLSSRLRMAAVQRKYTFTPLSLPDLYSPCITQAATLPPSIPPSGPGPASHPCSSFISFSSLLLLSWEVDKFTNRRFKRASLLQYLSIFLNNTHCVTSFRFSFASHRFFFTFSSFQHSWHTSPPPPIYQGKMYRFCPVVHSLRVCEVCNHKGRGIMLTIRRVFCMP